MQWKTETITDFETAIIELFQTIQYPSNPSGATVLCLHGDLGAGKTTAAQIIAGQLGITETIQSPTFVIKKTYTTNSNSFTRLVHIDAYRISPHDAIDVFGFTDDFSSNKTLVIIEWPEMIASVIPGHALHVFIQHTNDGRTIEIKKLPD